MERGEMLSKSKTAKRSGAAGKSVSIYEWNVKYRGRKKNFEASTSERVRSSYFINLDDRTVILATNPKPALSAVLLETQTGKMIDLFDNVPAKFVLPALKPRAHQQGGATEQATAIMDAFSSNYD